jgi:DNA polymerase elongation subunit (family B)
MKAKILYLDLETSPNIGWFWSASWKTSISTNQITDERQIIMASYKWAGEKKVHRIDWGLKKQCDKQLLKKLSKVINEADLVVAHNGDRFDLKWINTRLLFHGLDPLHRVNSEDTLKLAKRHFNFNSNRLDYIGQYLKVGRKIETGGIQLWLDIIFKKSKTAMNKMGKYCDQDVVLLEKVHNKLSKFNERTYAVYSGDTMSCNNCGSDHLHANRSYKLRSGAEKKVLTCQSCGSSKSVPMQKYLKEKK